MPPRKLGIGNGQASKLKMDHARSAEPTRMVHQLCLTRSWTYFWGEAAGAGTVVGALAAGPVTGTMMQRVTAT